MYNINKRTEWCLLHTEQGNQAISKLYILPCSDSSYSLYACVVHSAGTSKWTTILYLNTKNS